MLNFTNSTADRFRYAAGAVLSLIVVFSIFATDSWDQATVWRTALVYPPTVLLIAALVAPRKWQWVLREVAGVICGIAICVALFVIFSVDRLVATAADNVNFAKIALWLPIHAAGLCWALTGHIAPRFRDTPRG
jgi:uncharacterized membrane protein